jgi:hypothetical protein
MGEREPQAPLRFPKEGLFFELDTLHGSLREMGFTVKHPQCTAYGISRKKKSCG